MLIFVLASALLTAVCANFCCTPSQWEGDMGIVVGSVVNGTSYLSEGGMKISYDATTRMIVTRQDLFTNNIHIQQTIIDDYSKGMSYRLSADGKCTRNPVGDWVPNCIPDNATETRFHYGLGSDTVAVRSYYVDYGSFEVYYAVTADTCVPIAEDITGMFGGAEVMEAITFANIKAGISDNSVFTVPSVCTSAPLTLVPGFGSRRSSPFR